MKTLLSRAAYKINMPESEGFWEQYYMPWGIDYEFAARASDLFHFDLSDELARKRCGGGCSVEIKLSYLGTSDANIWVETAAGNSGHLALSNDHQIHTASFGLSSRFSNGLENGADLIVHTQGGELELLLVRLVFQP